MNENRWGASYGALVPHEWATHPVMHKFKNSITVDGREVYITECGRRLSSYTPFMSYAHAKLFARKCKTCDKARG